MLSALSTFLLRTRSATRRAFCGDRCTPFSTADTCIVMLLLLSLLVGRVTLERTGQCEFAELVANHVFRNQHRNMLPAIVDRNRQADEIRQNCGTTRPSLDRTTILGCVRGFHLLQQMTVDERTLFNRTSHNDYLLFDGRRLTRMLSVRLLLRV